MKQCGQPDIQVEESQLTVRTPPTGGRSSKGSWHPIIKFRANGCALKAKRLLNSTKVILFK